jgi:hypothetical protein
MKTGTTSSKPSVWRRRLGAGAAFLVSGIIHELIIWCQPLTTHCFLDRQYVLGSMLPSCLQLQSNTT